MSEDVLSRIILVPAAIWEQAVEAGIEAIQAMSRISVTDREAAERILAAAAPYFVADRDATIERLQGQLDYALETVGAAAEAALADEHGTIHRQAVNIRNYRTEVARLTTERDTEQEAKLCYRKALRQIATVSRIGESARIARAALANGDIPDQPAGGAE